MFRPSETVRGAQDWLGGTRSLELCLTESRHPSPGYGCSILAAAEPNHCTSCAAAVASRITPLFPPNCPPVAMPASRHSAGNAARCFPGKIKGVGTPPTILRSGPIGGASQDCRRRADPFDFAVHPRPYCCPIKLITCTYACRYARSAFTASTSASPRPSPLPTGPWARAGLRGWSLSSRPRAAAPPAPERS